MNKPWPALGIGWLLALVVVIIGVLVLLGAIAGSTQLIWISIILLALALLI